MRVRSSRISPVRWRQTVAVSVIRTSNGGFLFHGARPSGRSFIPPNDKRAAMRVLFLHVDYLEYDVREKALKGVPDVPQSKRHGRIEEALVCFISAEERGEANPASTARAAAATVADVAGQLHSKRTVLYPHAHPRSALARPGPPQPLMASL